MPRRDTVSKKKNVDRALYDAVKQGNVRLVKGYLTAGANPNAVVGKKGLTAMHRATKRKKNGELVAVLVEHGGEVPGESGSSQAQHSFKVGDRVSLVRNYREIGSAMYGPLESTFDVGVVHAIEKTDEDECIKVKFNNETYMYSPEALVLAEPEGLDPTGMMAKTVSTRKKASALQAELQQQLANIKPKKHQGMSRLAQASMKSLKGRGGKQDSDEGNSSSDKKESAPEPEPEPSPSPSPEKPTKSPSPVKNPTPVKEAPLREKTDGDRKREPKKSIYGQASPQDWEFDRGRVIQGDKLGEGMFGLVYSGTAKNLVPGESETKVAIKTLADESEEVEKDFFKEVEIMQAIDGPYKIVRLLGVCTKQKPYWMLMELMSRGDLKTVLRDHRPKKKKPSSFNMQQIVQMAIDIAEGMDYLAFKHIVHRDLAARNCLVDENFCCKIGDFGLTRNVYQDEYYRMTGSAPLPVRWMAPEALMDGVSTSKSDVWSYGIVLWELITFAKLPYGLLSNNEVCDMVTEEDYRMPMPKGCPEPLYDIMLDCWDEEPDARPEFSVIYEKMSNILPTFSKDPIEYAKKDPDRRSKIPAAASEGLPKIDDKNAYAQPQNAAEVEVDGSASEDEGANENDNDEQAGYVEPAASGGDSASGYGKMLKKPNRVTMLLDEDQRASQSRMEELLAHVMKFTDNPGSASGGAENVRMSKILTYEQTKKVGTPPADLEKEMAKWIGEVTKKKVGGDLHAELKTGELLCELMNKLVPGSIKKYHVGKKIAFRQMENIGWFLEVARVIGVAESDLFITNDLFENANMRQVLICLNAVKKITSSPTFKKAM